MCEYFQLSLLHLQAVQAEPPQKCVSLWRRAQDLPCGKQRVVLGVRYPPRYTIWAPTVQLCGAVGGGSVWAPAAPFPCRGFGMGMATEPVGEQGLSCKGERTGCLPAGSFMPTRLRTRGILGELLLPSCSPMAPTALYSCRPQVSPSLAEGLAWFVSSRSGGALLHPLTSMQTFPWTPVWVGSSLA